MKLGIAVVMALFSMTSLAKDLNQITETFLKEKKCRGGKDRIFIQIKSDREEKAGSHYIGVTSLGDVAVLEDNKVLNLFLCDREGVREGSVSADIGLLEAQENHCAVGEIMSLDVLLENGDFIPFRSFRYDRTGLCAQETDGKVNSSGKEEVKDKSSLMVPQKISTQIFQQ